jgi:hypothetical protein
MMRTLLKYGFPLGTVAIVAIANAAPAAAAVIVATDRASWEALVSSFTVETFSAFDGAQTEGAGVDIGSFTVQQVGTDFGGLFSEISTTVGTAFSINQGPALGGATNAGGTGIRFTFESLINSWAADLSGFSDGGRSSAIAINISGSPFTIAEGQTFFGVVDTTNFFNQVDVVYVSGDPDGVALDNVSYGTTTPIPTPALLPGLIGLGLGVLRKRKAEAAKSANEV